MGRQKSVERWANRGPWDGLSFKADVSGGLPCLARSGIIASVVVDMFVAGDSIESLARNYNRPKEQIIQAIRLRLLSASRKSKRDEWEIELLRLAGRDSK